MNGYGWVDYVINSEDPKDRVLLVEFGNQAWGEAVQGLAEVIGSAGAGCRERRRRGRKWFYVIAGTE